jgi:T5orf172 domain
MGASRRFTGGYVYLLQELGLDGRPTGLYKIGKTTKDTETRKKQYKAGNARATPVYAVIQVEDPTYAETALKRYYHEQNVYLGGGAEWFQFENPNAVVEVMQQYGWLVEEEEEDDAPVTHTNDREYTDPHHYDDGPEGGWWALIINVGMIGLAICFLGAVLRGCAINSQPQQLFPGALLYHTPNRKPTGKGIPAGTQVTIVQRQGKWCKTPDVGWFVCSK